MNRDDPKFYVAVAAAMVDESRAARLPGIGENGRPEPSHTVFTRDHVQLLHDSGATREDALAYAGQFLNPVQVQKFASDLNSYGTWEGD